MNTAQSHCSTQIRETLRTVVVGNGLRQIAVSGDDLLVLTQQGEDGPARLTRYALADMSERSGVYITPPSGPAVSTISAGS